MLPHLPHPCVDKGQGLLDFVRDKHELCDVVWDEGLCSLLRPGDGSQDGANHLYFAPAGSNHMRCQPCVLILAGRQRSSLHPGAESSVTSIALVVLRRIRGLKEAPKYPGGQIMQVLCWGGPVTPGASVCRVFRMRAGISFGIPEMAISKPSILSHGLEGGGGFAGQVLFKMGNEKIGWKEPWFHS